MSSLIKVDFSDLVNALNASTQATHRTEERLVQCEAEFKKDIAELKKQLEQANTKASTSEAARKAGEEAEGALQTELKQALERTTKLETDFSGLQSESVTKAQLAVQVVVLESAQQAAAQMGSDATALAVKKAEKRMEQTVEALRHRVVTLEAREEEAVRMVSDFARYAPAANHPAAVNPNSRLASHPRLLLVLGWTRGWTNH